MSAFFLHLILSMPKHPICEYTAEYLEGHHRIEIERLLDCLAGLGVRHVGLHLGWSWGASSPAGEPTRVCALDEVRHQLEESVRLAGPSGESVETRDVGVILDDCALLFCHDHDIHLGYAEDTAQVRAIRTLYPFRRVVRLKPPKKSI